MKTKNDFHKIGKVYIHHETLFDDIHRKWHPLRGSMDSIGIFRKGFLHQQKAHRGLIYDR